MRKSVRRPKWRSPRLARISAHQSSNSSLPAGVAFFGPVISRLHAQPEAVPLWDHVLGLASFLGFAELKRSGCGYQRERDRGKTTVLSCRYLCGGRDQVPPRPGPRSRSRPPVAGDCPPLTQEAV